jgi:hypothetical protein
LKQKVRPSKTVTTIRDGPSKAESVIAGRNERSQSDELTTVAADGRRVPAQSCSVRSCRPGMLERRVVALVFFGRAYSSTVRAEDSSNGAGDRETVVGIRGNSEKPSPLAAW